MKYIDEVKARAVELVIQTRADSFTANGPIARAAYEFGLSKKGLLKVRTTSRLHRFQEG